MNFPGIRKNAEKLVKIRTPLTIIWGEGRATGKKWDSNSVNNMQVQNHNLPTTSQEISTQDNYNLTNFEHLSIIGVYAHERLIPQKLIFDIYFQYEKTINHHKNMDYIVLKTITDATNKRRPQLLENIAYKIAKNIPAYIPQITGLNITIKKPAALKNARCSYVTLSMKNP